MLSSNWENLSRCSTKSIHVCKSYHLHWIVSRANILSKYIIYVFFNFAGGFYDSFLMLLPKAPASCCKKILNSFLLHSTSIFMSSKSMSQIFKILFGTGDIIFCPSWCLFRRNVQLKSSFSDEKNICCEIWDILH